MTDDYQLRLYDMAADDEEPPPMRRPEPAAAGYFADAVIQHGLGRLGVDRAGTLAGIEFDERALRLMRPEPVGAYLLAALHAAEDAAARRRGRRTH